MKIKGQEILLHIHNSLSNIQNTPIVIATSDNITDDVIDDFCHKNSIECFRGNLENVALRYLSCMRYYNFDWAFRISGDNLFIDYRILEEFMEDLTKSPELDFITNVHKRTFPFGISVELVNRIFFEEQYKNFTDSVHFEHVTSYFYENEDLGNRKYIYNTQYPEVKGMHLAIDTKKDLLKAEKIIQNLSKPVSSYRFKEICEIANSALLIES